MEENVVDIMRDYVVKVTIIGRGDTIAVVMLVKEYRGEKATIVTLANLLVEIENEKNKNASLTSYIVHGVKISLSGFSKLAPSTFKGLDNFEDP
ncbi:hypothetical protein Peur_053036 [Populus x canadensis]